MAKAKMPGSGPRLKATTKISANTISGTVRENSSKRRVANTSQARSVMFLLARKHSTSAPAAPSTVPT